jgi:hypothetical protein
MIVGQTWQALVTAPYQQPGNGFSCPVTISTQGSVSTNIGLCYDIIGLQQLQGTLQINSTCKVSGSLSYIDRSGGTTTATISVWLSRGGDRLSGFLTYQNGMVFPFEMIEGQ